MATITTNSIQQEFQEKTAELRQKIVNSVSGNTQQTHGSWNKQRSVSKWESHGSGYKVSIYQGVKIENDPLEREIYVKCPSCSHKVFDSGLENELYTENQIRALREQHIQNQLDNNKDDEDNDRSESDEDGEVDNYDNDQEDENPFRSENGKRSSEKKCKDNQWQDEDEEEKKESLNHRKHGSSMGKVTLSKQQYATPNRKSEFVTSSTGKLQTPGQTSEYQSHHQSSSGSKSSNMRSNSNRRSLTGVMQSDSSSKYVNELEDVVLFCNKDTIISDFIDNSSQSINFSLIQNMLLMPFFQMRARILEKGTYFKIGDIEFYVAACEPYEFGKVTSKSIIRCTYSVSKADVMQRINLVPLRRLDNSRTAIMDTAIKPFLEANPNFYAHKNQILEFEDYEFYVKYARPFFGRVDHATTEIKIDSSTPKAVQVMRIAPIWEDDQAHERANTYKNETFEYLKINYLNPYFYCGFMCYVEKGETILIDNQEFFVNDCRPKCGIIDKQTIIDLEVGFTREVFKKKQVLADQRFAEKIQTRDGITQTSHLRMRPARDDQSIEEMLGFYSGYGHNSNLMEIFSNMRRQPDEQADNDGGEDQESQQIGDPNRQGQEESKRRSNSNYNAVGNSRTSSNRHEDNEYHAILREMMIQQAQLQRYGSSQHSHHRPSNVTPKVIVQALPERQITSEFLLRQEDEANKKCMICIMDYEDADQVRTMPCLHFFHTECIDKWLLSRGRTCPICKFDIKRNYNSSIPIEKTRSSHV